MSLARIQDRLEGLTPETRKHAEHLLLLCADQGIPLRITQGKRTVAEQRALYAQGREALESVNLKRHEAGLHDITEAENKRAVTWTLASMHVEGRAFDVVPMKRDGHGLAPWWSFKEWDRIGELGESLGLTWGGRWTTPDKPHFQVDGPVAV